MELSFDVSSPADFKHFRKNWVKKMRENLRNATNPVVYDGVGRLPDQVNPDQVNPETMDLTLRAGDKVVILRLRTDNLYVIGFRSDSGNWFEFDHGSGRHPMIPRSTNLRYSGAYDANGIGSLSERDAILGRFAVEGAINGLADYNGQENNDDEVKRCLRTLIVNFIESVRLNTIADRVAFQMSNPSDDLAERQLTARNIDEIRNWGSLSEALMMVVDNPTAAQNPFRDRFSHRGIFDAVEAAAVLGMALVTTRFEAQCQRRPRRDVDDVSGAAVRGAVLAEIIGVVIGNINDQRPGLLYGTISVTDGLGTLKLYDRGKDSYQEYGPGQWVGLVWPPRTISGADDFVIDVDLKDHYRFVFPPDREVARGQICWNSRDTVKSDYNSIITKEVNGEYGNVKVKYAVLTDAVVAVVEAALVGGDGDSEATQDVYGNITATTKMASGDDLKYTLFHTERDYGIGVRRNAAVPLQKKALSAPLCSQLTVQAELFDSNSDDQIAFGSVSFAPSLASSGPKQLRGMSVDVTWYAPYYE